MDEAGTHSEIHCSQCATTLVEGQDRETTDDGVFCRSCFHELSAQVRQVVSAQGAEINYINATVGGLGGAAIGVLVWWGFTVATEISFGLVAVVIGFAVGKGIEILTGGKRHLNLQIMAVAISVLAFVYAKYLVIRTFIQQEVLLPLLPDPGLLVEVLKLDAGLFDLIFLAIVVFQAWKMPAPIELAG
jgi:hypothetical protein